MQSKWKGIDQTVDCLHSGKPGPRHPGLGSVWEGLRCLGTFGPGEAFQGGGENIDCAADAGGLNLALQPWTSDLTSRSLSFLTCVLNGDT